MTEIIPNTTKGLATYYFMKALKAFTADKEVPIKNSYSSYPALDTLRKNLSDTSKAIDVCAVLTSVKRTNIPHREGPWEPIVQFGEYIYYNYSKTRIELVLSTFTLDETKSENLLDEICHFFSANVRIGMEGRFPLIAPDYGVETLTYQYYEPNKFNSYRIMELESMAFEHGGSLWENNFYFTVEMTKMLAVKYHTIETINVSSNFSANNANNLNYSGTTSQNNAQELGYNWPAFLYQPTDALGYNSGSTIAGNLDSQQGISVVFGIDPALNIIENFRTTI